MTIDPWYATLYQLITHLPLIPCLITSYRTRKKIVLSGLIFWQLLAISFDSPTFHLCQSTGFCLFGASVHIWRIIDNIQALGGTAVYFSSAIANAISHESINGDSIFWSLLLSLTIFGFTIVVVVTSLAVPGSFLTVDKAIVIILFAVCVTFLKFLYVDKGNTLIVEKFLSDWKIFIAISLIPPAIVCFIINIPDWEWLTHGTWHLLIFTSIDLWLMSTTAHLPDAPTYMYRIVIEEDGKTGREGSSSQLHYVRSSFSTDTLQNKTATSSSLLLQTL